MLANPHSPTENGTGHFAANRGGYRRDVQHKDDLRPVTIELLTADGMKIVHQDIVSVQFMDPSECASLPHRTEQKLGRQVFPSTQICMRPYEVSGKGPFLQPSNMPLGKCDPNPSPELVVRPETTGDDTSQPHVLPTHQPKPTRIESRQIGDVDEQSQSRKIRQSNWEQPNQSNLVPSKRAVPVQHKKRVYKDDEWEIIKPVLYELYMEQCLSLERVIQIMSQVHNFHAT